MNSLFSCQIYAFILFALCVMKTVLIKSRIILIGRRVTRRLIWIQPAAIQMLAPTTGTLFALT